MNGFMIPAFILFVFVAVIVLLVIVIRNSAKKPRGSRRGLVEVEVYNPKKKPRPRSGLGPEVGRRGTILTTRTTG